MQMQQTTYWFILSTYCVLEVLFLWHESALSNTPVNTGNSAEMSFRTGGHWKAESESRLRLSWRLQTSAHFTSLLIMALRVFMSPSRHICFSSAAAWRQQDTGTLECTLCLYPWNPPSSAAGLVWMCGCHWLLFWDWCRRPMWFWVMFVNPNR